MPRRRGWRVTLVRPVRRDPVGAGPDGTDPSPAAPLLIDHYLPCAFASGIPRRTGFSEKTPKYVHMAYSKLANMSTWHI